MGSRNLPLTRPSTRRSALLIQPERSVRPIRPFALDADAESGVRRFTVTSEYSSDSIATLHYGDCLELLHQIPSGAAKLIVTSPPYNVGKSYEKKQTLEEYLAFQDSVIEESIRVLDERGSICWEVGNHVSDGEVFPLDILLYPMFKKRGLKLRNRIVWSFGHGLHCSRRFSGRHETILWFTKGDYYVFNLDPVRVPSKYPGKRSFKGPNKGQLSGNPLGKNPTDVWDIPNVKFNHVEKTEHPCQFPVELVERLVLALTDPGDLVVDPFMGVGTTCVAAVLRGRRGAGAEIVRDYVATARNRVWLALTGRLRTRPMGRPVYEPPARPSVALESGGVQRLRSLDSPR